jgi:hypothetical protein
MSSQSSYSFAPSPGSSILGGGSPGRASAGEQLPALLFSPSVGMHSSSSHPGMGVEAVHAAATAAAAAAQLGGLRVGSPAPGSSSSGLAGLQQQRQQWGGSRGGLRPGEQVWHVTYILLRQLQRCNVGFVWLHTACLLLCTASLASLLTCCYSCTLQLPPSVSTATACAAAL